MTESTANTNENNNASTPINNNINTNPENFVSLSSEAPSVSTPTIEISPEKQALLDQIRALRQIFDKAHAESLKAQAALDTIKKEIHHIQASSEEEVVSIKAEAERQIYDLLKDIESYKREAQTQIAKLKNAIQKIYHNQSPDPQPSDTSDTSDTSEPPSTKDLKDI